MIGPNGPQRCSPELWQVWRDLQDTYNAPVHTHLLETKAQAVKSRQLWDGGLVAEMRRQGLLNSKLTAAHGIWLLESERRLLADFGVTVVHNPTSNLMLGSGVMPCGEYADCGVAIAIGSDSSNTGGRHDLFECIRLAAMLPRLSQPDYETWPSAADVMVNSIRAGANALGLGGELGQLVPGQLADLILLDMNKATAIGPAITPELIAQHAARGVVTDVMTDGNWLLRDRELQTTSQRKQVQTLQSTELTFQNRPRRSRELPNDGDAQRPANGHLQFARWNTSDRIQWTGDGVGQQLCRVAIIAHFINGQVRHLLRLAYESVCTRATCEAIQITIAH